MRNDLIEKAKSVYKEAKATSRKLRKELGIHPATTAAEVKASKCNGLTEAYVCFFNMTKVYPHAEVQLVKAEKI